MVNYHSSLDHGVGATFLQLPNLSADQLVDFPVSELVNRSDLSQAEIDAIFAALDLDPSAYEDLTVLPVGYSGFANEAFSTLWFSLGFEATF